MIMQAAWNENARRRIKTIRWRTNLGTMWCGPDRHDLDEAQSATYSGQNVPETPAQPHPVPSSCQLDDFRRCA